MTSPAEVRRDLLLSQYVACWEEFDELSADPTIYPNTAGLVIGGSNDLGRFSWRPRRSEPHAVLLDALYSRLPAKFPPLFERLLLTFRWADVSLDTYSLIANPPGPDLEGFFRELSHDRGLWDALVPSGYFRFAKGPNMDYDPVCFEMTTRKVVR